VEEKILQGLSSNNETSASEMFIMKVMKGLYDREVRLSLETRVQDSKDLVRDLEGFVKTVKEVLRVREESVSLGVKAMSIA